MLRSELDKHLVDTSAAHAQYAHQTTLGLQARCMQLETSLRQAKNCCSGLHITIDVFVACRSETWSLLPSVAVELCRPLLESLRDCGAVARSTRQLKPYFVCTVVDGNRTTSTKRELAPSCLALSPLELGICSGSLLRILRVMYSVSVQLPGHAAGGVGMQYIQVQVKPLGHFQSLVDIVRTYYSDSTPLSFQVDGIQVHNFRRSFCDIFSALCDTMPDRVFSVVVFVGSASSGD
tara:strand:+ start:1671 stop:2375 length:705 start_codon:yes stop_codon:yes gene_type:complete